MVKLFLIKIHKMFHFIYSFLKYFRFGTEMNIFFKHKIEMIFIVIFKKYLIFLSIVSFVVYKLNY